MLGKICRKLRIPVPGRGYWARKAAGYKVGIVPLPKLKDVPIIQRFKFPEPEPKEPKMAEPEPTDPEYLRIKEVEALEIRVDASAPLHRLVAATAKAIKSGHTDDRGYRSTRWHEGALDLHISPATVDRSIQILNTVVLALEKQSFPVSIDKESHHSVAKIFGHEIRFELVEKYNQIRIPEDQRGKYSYPAVRYQPNGILEFRVSSSRYGYPAIRDGKRQKLEEQISRILGVIVREARDAKLAAERRIQEEIERRRREIERQKLAEQIRNEEEKVANLETWVSNWTRAGQYRDFIFSLEKAWNAAGKDTSPEAEHGKRLAWMRKQADRLDPLVESPSSILDRKSEIERHWY